MAMTKEQFEKAEALSKSCPRVGRRKLMTATGCTSFAAQQYLQGVYTKGNLGKTSGRWGRAKASAQETKDGAPAQTPGRPGVSVREFLGRFDFEATLRKTVKDLCADRFVADADIRTACDIPVTSYRAVASLPEFQACQMKEGGTVWWSTRENVDRVRASARKWGISK